MVHIQTLILDDGGNVVERWYADHLSDVKACAELDARMIHLRQQPRDAWTRPLYDILRDADGVGEVRFKANRIQHRGLGYFGPGRLVFTFLVFATKGDDWKPRNAIKEAKRRKAIVEGNHTRAITVHRWGQ